MLLCTVWSDPCHFHLSILVALPVHLYASLPASCLTANVCCLLVPPLLVTPLLVPPLLSLAYPSLAKGCLLVLLNPARPILPLSCSVLSTLSVRLVLALGHDLMRIVLGIGVCHQATPAFIYKALFMPNPRVVSHFIIQCFIPCCFPHS